MSLKDFSWTLFILRIKSLLQNIKKNQQFTIYTGFTQKFTQILYKRSALSKRIKWVFEVYVRFVEFHKARTKRKMYIPS